jgi:hypothetical protein
MEEHIKPIREGFEFSTLRQKLASFEGIKGSTEVEEPIYDTVATLNLIDIGTDASCGGHDLRDVAERGIEEWDQRTGEKLPDHFHVSSPYVSIGGESKEEILSKKDKALALLDEFYKSRPDVDERIKLQIRDIRVKDDLSGFKIHNGVERTGFFTDLELKTNQMYINDNLDKLREEFEKLAEFIYKKYLAGYR